MNDPGFAHALPHVVGRTATRLRTIVTVAALASVPVGPALAHHSFSVGFDLSSKFTVTGTLTRMDWRNPHIELFLDVRGEQEPIEAWVIESMPPSFFRNRNVAKADFENTIGRTLTVQGVRSRSGARLGIAEKVTFPDGRVVTLLELQAAGQ